MSHTTRIKAIIISDIDALEAAVRELNEQGIRCTLKQNATPRAYSQGQSGMGKAPYVIELADASYDIGLYLREDGIGYEARTDFWNGSVEGQLGNTPIEGDDKTAAKLGKLYQTYGVEATAMVAERQGRSVTRERLEDGTVQLRIAS